MSAYEDTDGLCGVPGPGPGHLFCRYGMTHAGPHSWERHRRSIQGGIFRDEVLRRAYTTDSPAAQAILQAEARRER